MKTLYINTYDILLGRITPLVTPGHALTQPTDGHRIGYGLGRGPCAPEAQDLAVVRTAHEIIFSQVTFVTQGRRLTPVGQDIKRTDTSMDGV